MPHICVDKDNINAEITQVIFDLGYKIIPVTMKFSCFKNRNHCWSKVSLMNTKQGKWSADDDEMTMD